MITHNYFSMPTDSDEEDWYERRKRIDAEERFEDVGGGLEIRRPLMLAREQAFSMAGMPLELDDTYEGGTYRPAPEGKSVRLPHVMPNRTVVCPADALDGPYYGQNHYDRYQPHAGVNHARPPMDGGYYPNAPPQQHGLTDRLVSEALGPQLGRYMDPSVVEVARREMAEAYDLDERQLNTAAFTLTNPAYLEHVGGLRPEEFSDINQYSQRSLIRQAGNGANSHTAANYGVDQGSQPEDLLLVTTL